jgi:hypothetical protein
VTWSTVLRGAIPFIFTCRNCFSIGTGQVLMSSPVGPVVLEKIFKWPHPIVTFLWLSSLFWTNLNSQTVQPRITCINFDWFGLMVLWKIFKNFQCISKIYSFAIISPWRRLSHSFEQTWILSIQGWFLPTGKSRWNWPNGSEISRSRKCRSYGWADTGQSAIRIAHLSSQLRWAKKIFSVSTNIWLHKS